MADEDLHSESELDCGTGSDSDRETVVSDRGPSKKAKLGASTYRTKFNSAWKETYPFINEVAESAYSFYCTLCKRKVSCAVMGKHDVVRHVDTTMHTANVRASRTQSTLNFPSSSSSLMEKVIRAEVKVASMLVQHNIPLSVADELTPLFRDIFSDSEIAKQYSSRRTKTACMINGAIAPFFQKNLVRVMKEGPYSIAVDGSSDSDVKKMNPLTVKFFDLSRGVAITQFLDMCMSSVSTAEGIFGTVDDVLTKHGISWGNCVGIGLDNTSVNLGCHNSIKTRILLKNPSAYVMGCPCHIVHNTAAKAGMAFEKESGFNIEDLVIDLYYWFEKSTKRKASLSEYCSFCDINYRKIVKHVNTRWLSLERATTRVLQQYDALRSYFLSEEESIPRFQRLKGIFSKPMTEINLMFYESALQTFVSFNKFLQREDPLLPVLCGQMNSFLTKLASRFVPVAKIKAANKELLDLQYKGRENQHPDASIFVGISTKSNIRKRLEEGDITPHHITKFYASVRAFYVKAMDYALDNLPLKDDLLKNGQFVNFMSRESAMFSQVEYFVERFSSLLPYQTPQEMDQLMDEFLDYQLLEEIDIPQCVWNDATVVEDNDQKYYRMDILWHHMSTMKDPDSTYRFKRLSTVAMLLLVIPHSNAEEGVFSMVRKNKTAFRPSLDPEGTLSSILTIKLARSTQPSHTYEPTNDVLKRAKSATWEYNKTHMKK